MKYKKQNETEKDLISIIVPIYGEFDTNRALITIDSIKSQKGIKKEIIVSEQGETPKLKNRLGESIKYIFKKQSSSKPKFNPGKIRNLAIKEAKGEFICTLDADILFLNKNFLKKSKELLQKDPKLVLYRPLMKRIPIENFKEFKKRYKNKGVRKAIESLDLSQKYLATTDAKIRELKVVKKEGEGYKKTFTASRKNFKKYLQDKSLKGKEPKIWTESLHCGGNFFRKRHFDKVGGYCEDFINWGCEDSDLQWKFKEKFNLQFFPKKENFVTLHLDHEKGYFSPESWKRNEGICSKRIQEGIEKAIRRDKTKWETKKQAAK